TAFSTTFSITTVFATHSAVASREPIHSPPSRRATANAAQRKSLRSIGRKYARASRAAMVTAPRPRCQMLAHAPANVSASQVMLVLHKPLGNGVSTIRRRKWRRSGKRCYINHFRFLGGARLIHIDGRFFKHLCIRKRRLVRIQTHFSFRLASVFQPSDGATAHAVIEQQRITALVRLAGINIPCDT